MTGPARGRRKAENAPKEPQQPIIDALKDAGHGYGWKSLASRWLYLDLWGLLLKIQNGDALSSLSSRSKAMVRKEWWSDRRRKRNEHQSIAQRTRWARAWSLGWQQRDVEGVVVVVVMVGALLAPHTRVFEGSLRSGGWDGVLEMVRS